MIVTTFDKSFCKSFVVGEQFFRRIEDFLSANKTSGKYKVWLSENSTIDGLVTADLIALPNSKLRQITRVTFSTPYNADTRVEFGLRNVRSQSIDYTVRGSDKEASYISSELEKYLRELFLPHSYFSAMSDGHKMVWWLTFSISSWVLIGLGAYFSKPVISLIGVAINVVPLIYSPVMRRLFPVGVFAIGDGISRAETIRSRRATILSIMFVAVIIGALVNLSSSYIYDRWSK